jgi:putative tryptophan/tyrosine transport system substrate-binding protein
MMTSSCFPVWLQTWWRRPELIYAPPSTAALAARKATASIPIVFATSTDPVGSGLVQSLARPGGNVTGASSVAESLAPRLVQLLREIVPSVNVIGFVGDPFDPRWKIDGEALARLEPTFGITIRTARASDPGQLDAAIDALIKQRVHAIVTGSTITYNLRHRLMEIASRSQVPVAGHRAELAEAGALLSYSGPLHEQLRRSAQLVDKVLRGQRPADIPVEQPTKFELVVNLNAAKALGLTVPQSVVLAADRLIQ